MMNIRVNSMPKCNTITPRPENVPKDLSSLNIFSGSGPMREFLERSKVVSLVRSFNSSGS
jgi:hypothetical protein